MSLLLMAPGACSPAPDRGDDPRSDEARALFGDEPRRTAGSGDTAVEPGGFAILLATVPPSMRARPELAVASVAEAVGGSLDEARVRLYDPAGERPPIVVYGRYEEPGTPDAQGDLARLQQITVEGRQPFARAVFVPTPAVAASNVRIAEHDLRRAKARFGSQAVYTLQIGVYTTDGERRPTPDELASFRELAEQAVADLRDEGEQAFYYHGPNGSMVTVGVFGERDLDTSVVPPIESRRLRDARSRHPHNLLNGKGVREIGLETGEATPRLQQSRLVLIPE